MHLNPNHTWYLKRKWLLKPSVQIGFYLCVLIVLLATAAILLFKDPLPRPFRNQDGSCTSAIFPLIAFQGGATALGCFMLVFLLWKAKDTIFMKNEMKLLLYTLLPLFIVWIIVQIFPQWFPENFFSGYIVMIILPVSFS